MVANWWRNGGVYLGGLWGEEGVVSDFFVGVFDIFSTFFGLKALACANIIYMVLGDSCTSTLKSPNFSRNFILKITIFTDFAIVAFNVLMCRYIRRKCPCRPDFV